MTEIQVSSAQLAAIAGVPVGTIDRWCGCELLRPTLNEGGPKGTLRRYGLPACVAACLGAAFRDAGLPFEWLGPAVKLVANMTPEQLGEAIAQGRVVPVPGLPGVVGPSLVALPKDKKARSLARELSVVTALKKAHLGLAVLAKKKPELAPVANELAEALGVA